MNKSDVYIKNCEKYTLHSINWNLMAGQQQSQSRSTHTVKQQYICLQNMIYLPQCQICRIHNWGGTWSRCGDPDLHGNTLCWETLPVDSKLVHHLHDVVVTAEPWPQPLMLPSKLNLQHQYITSLAILQLHLMSWISPVYCFRKTNRQHTYPISCSQLGIYRYIYTHTHT